MTTPKTYKGKQTVKQLVGQGAGVTNIEITDNNIKAFESTARKYGVDFALKKDASTLFLGGKEKGTLKEISELLGKETVDLYNTSITRSNQTSHGQNFSKAGKDLMSMDELAAMDGGKCILMLRGERPFLSRKYDITRHPNYRYLADANKKNTFDVDRFLRARLRPKPGETFEVYDIGDPGSEAPAAFLLKPSE